MGQETHYGYIKALMATRFRIKIQPLYTIYCVRFQPAVHFQMLRLLVSVTKMFFIYGNQLEVYHRKQTVPILVSVL